MGLVYGSKDMFQVCCLVLIGTSVLSQPVLSSPSMKVQQVKAQIQPLKSLSQTSIAESSKSNDTGRLITKILNDFFEVRATTVCTYF